MKDLFNIFFTSSHDDHDLIKDLVKQGFDQFEKGDIHAALSSFDKALEYDEGIPVAWQCRGICKCELARSTPDIGSTERQKYLNQATESFKKASELNTKLVSTVMAFFYGSP